MVLALLSMTHEAAVAAAGSVKPLRGIPGAAEFGARLTEPILAPAPARSPGELAPKLNRARDAPAAQRASASKSRGVKKAD